MFLPDSRAQSSARRWVWILILATLAVTAPTRAQGPSRGRQSEALARALAEHRHLDARVGLLVPAAAPLAAQQAEINALRAVLPDLRVDVDTGTGATRSLWNMGGYLTPADGRAARAIAEDFVASRTTLLGLTASDVVDVELTDEVYSPLSGVTHLYYRQRVNGIPVYNAQLQLNITRDGRILSVNNAFLPNITTAIPSLRPTTSARAAVRRAAEHLGFGTVEPAVALAARGARQRTELTAPELSAEPIGAELMVVPVRRGEARLAWNFLVWTGDGEHAFDFTVDAESGQIWTRTDWVSADQYRVYPRPVESPNHAAPAPPADGRVLVTNPAHAVASPFGWHDTNGAAGAEFTTTEGNNVSAYTDTDANNVPDAGSSPSCGAGLTCDFTIDLAQAPSAYRPAAVTNLFYWNNIVHDIQHRYGFDEASGNFQVNNYGRGGAGNDSVQAEAQDGSGVNNANFATPPDGQRPRMQMFLFNAPTPDLDGDLDAGVVVHEYGHGISNRLVGGPSNVNCLANAQQPGEGISDWLALVYTALPGHTGATPRGIGTYILNQPTTGAGIRTQRYSTDPAVNTFTYASISSGTLTVPHGIGSVWAQGMWEVYWALVDQYGFSPDLYNATGGAGNQRAMLYHNEGLKNTACSPGFTQVRDGIIQAAQTINGGADVCRLWTAFAGFGLGTNAVNPSPASNAGIVNGFDVPVACGGTGSPSMSIDDVQVSEGNGGTTTATFTVSLATAPASEARVNFQVVPGTATAAATTMTSGAPIAIPAVGPATPYPATLSVAGLTGTIANVAVRLNGFAHAFPEDVDMLLVGPGGQRALFMSDIGSGLPVSGIDLTFQDGAPAPTVPLQTGTVAPTDVVDTPSNDTMPSPAPAGPYGTALSAFNGTNPNGTWTLYVRDDISPDGGSVTGGFSLIITTTATGDFVPTGGQLTFPPGTSSRTISVTVNGDTDVEPNETFSVNLSSAFNATIADAQGIGTIVNDDTGGGGGVQAPFNLRVDSVVGNTVTLRWDTSPAGPQASTFVLEGGVTPGQVLASIPTGSPSPVFTFIAPAGSWSIRMHGQLGTDKSAASNEVALHVNVPVRPSAPANLQGLVNGSTVDLAWKNTFEGGPATGLALDVTGTATLTLPMGVTERFSFSPVPGGTYTFRVRQTNAGGSSLPSSPVTLSFPAGCTGAPQVPANALGYRIGRTVFVIWDPPAAGPAPTAYLLNVTGTFTGSLPTTARALSGTVGPGVYHLSVVATNACGASAATPAQTITVP
jgi:extracellular elastinolytic metalloproteinase